MEFTGEGLCMGKEAYHGRMMTRGMLTMGAAPASSSLNKHILFSAFTEITV